jgi:hypothetical protein
MIIWLVNKLGLLPFILWMKRSFEENGEPSSRRFGAAHCMMLVTYIIISKSDINIYMWYSLLVLTGLMWGLITAQNIIAFKNGDKTEPPKP